MCFTCTFVSIIFWKIWLVPWSLLLRAFQTEVPFFNHSSVSPTITYPMSHQLWLQIMLFGNSQSPTATELYMPITRRFFFTVVKLLDSSRHISMPITDEPSSSVSYSYMYTTCDGCVVAALHNVTSWHVTFTFRGRCEFALAKLLVVSHNYKFC